MADAIGSYLTKADAELFRTLGGRIDAPLEIDPPARNSRRFKPLCDCNVPPWEDCEHTEALANAAMLDQLSL